MGEDYRPPYVAPLGYNLTAAVGETFEEDGQDFRVLHIDRSNHRALILREYLLPDRMTFGSTYIWRDSPIREKLNSTYFESLTNLKEFIQEVEITTRASSNYADGTFITTLDKVFLLSEADVFGTTLYFKPAVDEDFTVSGRMQFFADEDSRKAKILGESSTEAWWLRSPHQTTDRVIAVTIGGTVGYHPLIDTYNGIRPAMWITIQ